MSDSSRFINQRVAAMRHQQRLELAMRARQAQSQQFARANYEPPPNFSMVGQAAGLSSTIASLLGIAPLMGSSAGLAATAGTIINGGWTPLSLGSKLKFYLEPSGIVSSGGFVSDWNDSSGNGYHLTQATSGKRPATSTINGVACISCDGVDDEMGRALAMSNILSTSAFHISGVIRPTAVPGSGTNIWEVTSAFGDSLGYVSLAPMRDVSGVKKLMGGYGWDGSGKPLTINETTVTLPNSFYVELRLESGTLYARIGNTDVSASFTTVSVLTGTLLLGRGYNSGNANRWWTGGIGETFACNAALSGPELASTRAYYASKYAVTT